nr:NADH dehydrogenase subunit 4L [Thylacodes adamsii]
MSTFYLSICAMGFMSSMLAVALQHKHLLAVLLGLEGAMMSLFIMLLAVTSSLMVTYSVLIFITLSVCEASLGLAVLVSAVRAHGNDYVKSFSMQSC